MVSRCTVSRKGKLGRAHQSHAQADVGIRHIRAMLVVGENAGRHINDFSQQFQKEFLQLLSRK